MSGEHLERRLEGLESEFADAALERLRAVLARASDDALLDLAAFVRDDDEDGTLEWLGARRLSEEDVQAALGA